MDCADIEARGVAEEYLLGRLTAEEEEAYERHYFECARCYSELESVRAVRAALSAAAPASSSVRRWMPLAAAAALVLGIAVVLAWQWTRVLERRTPQPPAAAVAPSPVREAPRTATTEEFSRLARLEPPPYASTTLRGGGARAAFAAGMRKYVVRDYAGAIPLLEAADGEDARFYLGACYLLTGRYADARATLEPIGRDTDSSYAEEALYLAANADLKVGDGAGALAALDRTIALRGDREQDARALRERVMQLLGR